jgi:hypothetical protein
MQVASYKVDDGRWCAMQLTGAARAVARNGSVC